MKDENKTKKQLLNELVKMRQRISKLEKLESKRERSEESLQVAIKRAEDEKATRSEAIITAIGDAISIQDTNFKVLFQNQRHKDIVGDQVGEYCYKAYQQRDHVCEKCHLSMAFKDGKIHRLEQSRTTDKGITYAEITGSPLRDSTGKIIAGIEVVRDITKRKWAEEEFKKAHDVLEIRIKERTEEIVKANEVLLAEINERKKIEEELRDTEKKLKIHSKELLESNTALKVLLKQRENDKREFEDNILSNMKHLILPYIAKLKKKQVNVRRTCLFEYPRIKSKRNYLSFFI